MQNDGLVESRWFSALTVLTPWDYQKTLRQCFEVRGRQYTHKAPAKKKKKKKKKKATIYYSLFSSP